MIIIWRVQGLLFLAFVIPFCWLDVAPKPQNSASPPARNPDCNTVWYHHISLLSSLGTKSICCWSLCMANLTSCILALHVFVVDERRLLFAYLTEFCVCSCLTVFPPFSISYFLCREHLTIGNGQASSKGNCGGTGQKVEVAIVIATASLEQCCWRANSSMTQVCLHCNSTSIQSHSAIFDKIRLSCSLIVRSGPIFMLNFILINILGNSHSKVIHLTHITPVWAYES